MAFWGDSLSAGSRDPKRKYRFRVLMETLGGGNVVWYAKTAGKPEITVSGDTEHKFLGHTFKFPGSVSWNAIEIVLVDPGEEGEGEDQERSHEPYEGADLRARRQRRLEGEWMPRARQGKGQSERQRHELHQYGRRGGHGPDGDRQGV